jgi:hypothetical protein
MFNELNRLRKMAGEEPMPESLCKKISIVNLRGRLMDLNNLGAGLMKIEPGKFGLIIIDAFYRTIPNGTDENSNASMAGLYNRLDYYADALGAAFAPVHHSSKGSQSGKAVTDVGAGAGAQSRATDTHLILRPHEQENAVVLDAAVRSFGPVAPLCLRWNFPLWAPAPDLDPTKLQSGPGRKRKPEADEPPEDPWTAERFAGTFGTVKPQPRDVILEQAREAKLSEVRAKRLLSMALNKELLFSWKEGGANTPTLISTARQAKEPKTDERR